MPAVPLDYDCLSLARQPDRFGYENLHLWHYVVRSAEGGIAAAAIPSCDHAIMVARHAATDRLTLMHTMPWPDIWETGIFLGLTEDYEDYDGGSGLSYAADFDILAVPSESPCKMEESLLLWLESRTARLAAAAAEGAEL